MRRIEFYKLQASGNDFMLIDARHIRGINYRNFAKKYCLRKLGVGADGLLVIEPDKRADFRMRIFNPDGSEAEMCGNGGRCAALWAKSKILKFNTKAGIIEARTKARSVKIKLSNPSKIKLNLAVKVLGRSLKVNYINTGVPHAVIFVEGLEKINVEKIGRAVRFHKRFSPQGTNVDFAEVLKHNRIKIRTYERGVEGETLACGTGAAAAAIVSRLKFNAKNLKSKNMLSVGTKSGEFLKVYFDKNQDKITNVWLEGQASLVYKGTVIN